MANMHMQIQETCMSNMARSLRKGMYKPFKNIIAAF